MTAGQWIYIGYAFIMIVLPLEFFITKAVVSRKYNKRLAEQIKEEIVKGLKDLSRYDCYKGLTEMEYSKHFLSLHENLENLKEMHKYKTDERRTRLNAMNGLMWKIQSDIRDLYDKEKKVKEYISSLNIRLAAEDHEELRKQKEVLENAMVSDILEGYKIFEMYKSKA